MPRKRDPNKPSPHYKHNYEVRKSSGYLIGVFEGYSELKARESAARLANVDPLSLTMREVPKKRTGANDVADWMGFIPRNPHGLNR